MRKMYLIVALGALLVFVQSCAHDDVSRRLDEKIAHENGVKSKRDLRTEVGKVIEQTPGLSPEQKGEIRSIRDGAHGDLEKLRLESLKLRSVLVKDIISADYDSPEVDLIKKRLQEVEDERLSTLFRAVRRTNVALGSGPRPEPVPRWKGKCKKSWMRWTGKK